MPLRPAFGLTLGFLRRELRNRFAGSFSGGLWLLIQPLIQLAVYAFVFTHIFKARVPGGGTEGYVAFLAIAFWPWTAFSESLLRSTTAIQDNAALIGKVSLPRELLVVAVVGSTFIVHLAGFIAVMLALSLIDPGVHIGGLPLAILLHVPLLVLALGFSLILAAIQVFVRDLAQVLGQILMLLMYATPIFYDRSFVPARLGAWLDLHPFTFYAESFRMVLLSQGHVDFQRIAMNLAAAVLVMLAGLWVFRRLDPHFEDFL
jgi:lipopolysaccharide transport system permease protein